MQKIIINNFGAVKSAEIEIKKVLILIGEQASGKSTIAKLIYFFRSLRDDLIKQVFDDTEKENFDVQSDFLYPLRDKFYDLFGSTYHLPDFEITFYYSVENDKYVRLTLDKAKKLNPKVSAGFFDTDFKNEVNETRSGLQLIENEKSTWKNLFSGKSKLADKMSNSIINLLQIKQQDNVFIVAGRTATVSYSELFEKYLFASIQNQIGENSSQTFKAKIQTIDSELMLRFIERVIYIKKHAHVEKQVENFFSMFLETDEVSSIKEKPQQNYKILRKQIDLILKGRYFMDDSGEKIAFNKNENSKEFIYLFNASSGQQEVIRILQDLLLIAIDNVKAHRIIEEPEAHLFPIAQKQLVELFALMVNQDIDNQLIITTHSPYILAAFNNLLFAKRVIEKNPNAEKEVSEIVAPEFRLDANEFAAYSLSHSEDYEYCTSIMSDRGLISENYLDTVSDILGNEFNILYSIHAKTFARK